MAKIRDVIKQKRLPVAKRLRILLTTIFLLLIPTLTYFTFYISDQTNNFNEQNFRHLASISDQIEQRIEGLKTAFNNAIKNALKIHPAGTSLSKGDFQQALDTASEQPAGTKFQVIDEETPKPEYAGPEEIARDFAGANIGINLKPEAGRLWLVFVCNIVHSVNSGPQVFTFRAGTQLKDLISRIVGMRSIESLKGSDHESGFDDILIASLEEKSQSANQQAQESGGSSKVIFQQEPAELDVASLDNLYRADDPEKTINFKNLSRSTNLIEVKLADSNYRLYLQPVNFGLKVESGGNQAAAANNQAASNDQQEQTRWVVCGLVQSNHFRHQTWAFSYTLLIIFAFAAAFIALSWPFLRLMFMGCKDRLRLSDAYFVASALLVGSAILTLFILYSFTYRHSENELDDQLMRFSGDIINNFSGEVSRATKEIDILDAKVSDVLDGKIDPSSLPGEDEASNKSANAEGRAKILSGIKDDPYPYFSRVSWINKKGCMQRQWATSGSTSDFICVSDRDYFKSLKEGRSRELIGEGRFWLEPVNSRLSGEKTVVVSKPIDDPRRKEAESIAAIDPHMISLMHTVVPPGFGYRVIDSSGDDPEDENKGNPGKVLFQSSETHQNSENFFEECDNNQLLRSLIFGHRSDFLNVNYRGSDHRLYVSPMPGFPNWSLVVFRNKQVLRTVYLQTLVLAGIIFLAYAIVFLIVFTVIYFMKINRRNRTEWVWPSNDIADIYYQAFFLNVILCIVGMVLISVTDGRLAIFSISVIAVIGIFILGIMLKFRKAFGPLDRAVKVLGIEKWFGKGNAYVWNMVMLLILSGILPAAAFFKVAYNQEMRLLVKQGQIKIAKEMAEREARIRSQFAPEIVGSVNLIDKRLNEPLDVYDNFFFKTNHSFSVNGPPQKKEEANDHFVVYFASLVPIFNGISIEQGGLIPTRPPDDAWEWLEPSDNVLQLHVPATQVSKPLYITTVLPCLRVTPLFIVYLGAAFLLFLWALFRLTRFVVRKIFLLDVDETLNISRLPRDAAKITENHFVVQSLIGARKLSFLTACGFYQINVETDSKVRRWIEGIRSKIEDKTLPDKIVIDNFDHGITYPGSDDQKLELVKTLLDANKVVVIMSSCEPAACSFGKIANDKASAEQGGNGLKTQHNGLNSRWVEIISGFRKVYSVESDNTELENAIKQVEAAFNAKPDRPWRSRRRFKQLIQSVRREAAPQAFLQDICVKIIKQNGFDEMWPDCVAGQIFDQAELYYREIWDDCSEGEKLTLLHLAQDRFLSPNDFDVKYLLQRGLIRRDPDIRFMTESFKRFVQSQSLSGGLESIETESRRSSPWDALRVPLLLIFVGVLLFLFLTQKNFYNSSLTVVTALTTSIPAFFKLLGIFQGDGGGSKA